jgi:hypothetical protein
MSNEIEVTREELIDAFEAWEASYRLNPSEHLTNEEVRNKDVRKLAEINADVLIDYVNKLK